MNLREQRREQKKAVRAQARAIAQQYTGVTTTGRMSATTPNHSNPPVRTSGVRVINGGFNVPVNSAAAANYDKREARKAATKRAEDWWNRKVPPPPKKHTRTDNSVNRAADIRAALNAGKVVEFNGLPVKRAKSRHGVLRVQVAPPGKPREWVVAFTTQEAVKP